MVVCQHYIPPDTSRMVDKFNFTSTLATNEGTFDFVLDSICLADNVSNIVISEIPFNILLAQLEEPFLATFFVYICTRNSQIWFTYQQCKNL